MALALVAGDHFLTRRRTELQREQTELRFRPNQVELLLNSAADLLERCLAQRQRIDDLAAQALREELDSGKERALLVVQRSRLASGWYEEPLNAARLRNRQASGLYLLHEECANRHHEEFNDSPQTFKVQKSVFNITLERYRQEVETAVAALSREENPGADRLAVKAETVARELLLARREQAAGGLKPLDFAGHIDVIQSRIERDYEESCFRLQAASIGMRQIFGYPGDEFIAADSENVLLGPIDAALKWVREAILWISSFSAWDQAFTVTLSVRSLLGQETWESMIRGEEVPFAVDAGRFRKHTHVRLRGVTCSTIATANSLPILRVTVWTPSAAVYALGDRDLAVDQSGLPSCLLGRVLPLTVPQPAEIAGSVSLLNASPVGNGTQISGDWRLQAAEISTKAMDSVEDLLMELRCSGRPSDVGSLAHLA